MVKRLRIESVYPDYGSDDFILHTNYGSFIISKNEIKKIGVLV